MLINLKGHCINILSDSRAPILALTSPQVKSKIVWDCLKLVRELSTENVVILIWVPRYLNILGNETADMLAQNGAESEYVSPEPFCGVSLNHMKTELRNELLSHAMQHYRNTLPGMMHAKIFIPSHSRKRTEDLLRLNRKQIRVVTGLLTGHLNLRKHLHRIGKVNDDICRLCNETAEHLLCNCMALEATRYLHFSTRRMNPAEFNTVPLDPRNYKLKRDC